MSRKLIVLGLLSLSCSLFAAEKIPIGDRETIVLYGDSITEQNLYAAYIETFLLTRLPRKDLTIYNFGWGGDTAAGGNARFARDVAPVKPTLVFVNFGMNDGRYTGPDQAIFDSYIGSQKLLADTIKAAGARQVLLTTSPIDYDRRGDKDLYNGALANMADGVMALAEERSLPVCDIFHPMRQLQADVKAGRQDYTMIPDSVHPNAVGHLPMAYYVLRELDVPGLVGTVAIADGKLKRAEGLAITGFKTTTDGFECSMSLSCLPFYVPQSAREALTFVPFQEDLNTFTLTVDGLAPDQRYLLVVNGVESGSFSAKELAEGADLALLENAPWTLQSKMIWDLAQARWNQHFEAWRKTGMEQNPLLAELPEHKQVVTAQKQVVARIGEIMHEMAAAKHEYQVALIKSNIIDLPKLEISPSYPYKGDFDARYPPEIEPASVEWKTIDFSSGQVDLFPLLTPNTDCAVYIRAVLEADADCRLLLAMGSDDGLKVIVNGETVHANNVARGLRVGEDKTLVDLKNGRNVILFRITQGTGDFAFAAEAKIMGETKAKLIPAN